MTIKNKNTIWSNIFKIGKTNNDLETIIANTTIFNKLNKKSISKISEITHTRKYETGEKIFVQGDPGIGLYIVQEGIIKIYQTDKFSNDREIIEFAKGDFFGDMALFDNEIRSATAVSHTESKLIVIFKPDLDNFIDRNPSLGINILRSISQIIVTRLRQLNIEHSEVIKKLETFEEEVENGNNKENINTC